MTDVAETIDQYFEAWNETDELRRRQLLESVYPDDGRYVDPLADADGHLRQVTGFFGPVPELP